MSCLKLGTQTPEVIAAESELPAGETLLVLKQLHARGFVSRFSTDREFFTAESPTVVIGILENEHYVKRKHLEELQQALPAFKDVANPTVAKPEIAFYKGKDGIIAAYEDTLTSKTEILALTSIDDTEAMLADYVSRYYQRRKTAGILIKAIFPDTPLSRQRQIRDGEELRESRLVPKHFLDDFHIEYYLYDDKVAYFSVREGIAVIMKSPLIAGSMRTVFAMLWQLAGKLTAPAGMPESAKAATH